MIIRFLKHLRIKLWWNHIIPPVAGIFYVFLFINDHEFPDNLWLTVLLFTLSILGTAGFGYYLNDWTDIEFDRRAGKRNVADLTKPVFRGMILLFLLIIGVLPWIFLPFNLIALLSYVLLILSLTLYSLPPFRLKEHSVAGPVCDALYGHVLPVFIALGLGSTLFKSGTEFPRLVVVLLFFWLMTKGFRNILLHQIDDRRNDRKSGLKTFVLSIGPLKSLRMINFVLIPLEAGWLTALLWSLSGILPGIVFTFWGFILFSFVLFRGWFMFRKPYRKIQFRYLYFFNDYCEAYLPVILLIYLIREKPELWFLFPLHLVFFPGITFTIYRDLRKLIRDFFIDLCGDIYKYANRRVGYWINKD